MGHGSWFSHFFGSLYAWVVHLMSYMGWPFNDQGKTWGLLGQHHDIAINEGHGAQAFLHVLLVTAVLLVMAVMSYAKLKDRAEALVPDDKLTVRTFVELVVGATYDVMKDIMGASAARFFLPLIGTCAFFILFSNATGLIPGFLPPTSSLSVTLACSVVIFVATHIFGLKEHGLSYFKHFLGPIIKWYALPLMVLFVVVETISHLVRPMSLSIRLMANLFADHAVIGVFLAIFAWILPVPVLLLGALVVVVQAFVFCVLSTVYIAMAIEHAEDH